MSVEPPNDRCMQCGQIFDSTRGHNCPLDDSDGTTVIAIALVAFVICILLLAVGVVKVSAASPRSGSALVRAIRLVDAHPAWRDGRLRRGRVAGCDWQARIGRDGDGYAGVLCGYFAGVALRDKRGRWRA